MDNAKLYGNGTSFTMDTIGDIPTPMGTSTWTPLPHHEFLKTIHQAVRSNGFQIDDIEMYANDGHYTYKYETLRQDDVKVAVPNANLFGVARISPLNWGGLAQRDLGQIPVIGFRNSNCKDFQASATLGSQVLVCNNMCYSGDITVFRRHTTNIIADFKAMTVDAFGVLGDMVAAQNARIEAYKNTHFWDNHMHDLCVKAIVDHNILPANKMDKVIDEWRNPEHEEFHPRTLYSAWNAFTTVFKELNQRTLQQRTVPLHELCDTAAGLN